MQLHYLKFHWLHRLHLFDLLNWNWKFKSKFTSWKIKQIIIFFVQIMSWIKLKYLLNVFFFIDNVWMNEWIFPFFLVLKSFQNFPRSRRPEELFMNDSDRCFFERSILFYFLFLFSISIETFVLFGLESLSSLSCYASFR